MALNIEAVTDAGIELTTKGDTVVIRGNLDCADPGQFLNPFLDKVHHAALKNGTGEVLVDFTGLKFLNSSGITEFSDWIFKVEEAPKDKRYKIVFLCNSEDYKWQKSSVQTMIYLNPEICSMRE